MSVFSAGSHNRNWRREQGEPIYDKNEDWWIATKWSRWVAEKGDRAMIKKGDPAA